MNEQDSKYWASLIQSLAINSKRADRLELIAIFQFLVDRIHSLELEVEQLKLQPLDARD